MTSVRADGAFRPEDKPILELDHTFDVWDGITSMWFIMHTENLTLIVVMHTWQSLFALQSSFFLYKPMKEELLIWKGSSL